MQTKISENIEQESCFQRKNSIINNKIKNEVDNSLPQDPIKNSL